MNIHRPSIAASSGGGPVLVNSVRVPHQRTAAFPSLLRECRPTLVSYDRVKAGSDSEVGRLFGRLVRFCREKSERETGTDIRARIRALEAEGKRSRDGARLSVIDGEIRAARRQEAEVEAESARRRDVEEGLYRRLHELTLRHNSIIAALQSGTLRSPVRRVSGTRYTEGGASSGALSADEARRLADESIRLVGRRLLSDDTPEPAYVPPPSGNPAWSTSTPAGEAVLLADAARRDRERETAEHRRLAAVRAEEAEFAEPL